MSMTLTFTRYLSLSILAAFLSTCGDENSSPILRSEVHHSELNWGEYLQKESETSLITVSRGDISGGIVRLHLDSNRVEVIDPTAREARDLLLSQGQIAYRLNDEIHLSSDASRVIATGAARLRSFFFDPKQSSADIAVDGIDRRSYLIHFTTDPLQETTALPILGSVRASFEWKQDQYFLIQTATGLELGKRSDLATGKSFQKVSSVQSSYAAVLVTADDLHIVYLDDDTEDLKWARRPAHLDNGDFEIKPLDSELRQDLELYDDHGKPGVFGVTRDLTLRWSHSGPDGNIVSEDLPFQGALGFYPKVISAQVDALEIAFHTFRTTKPDGSSLFESLTTARISRKK
jgi:hypothetical protein